MAYEMKKCPLCGEIKFVVRPTAGDRLFGQDIEACLACLAQLKKQRDGG